MMRIGKRIQALRMPFDVATPQGKIPRFVYAYLVYGEKVCLIDSGVASSHETIFDHLKKEGLSPKDIDLLVLTHSHPDHIGSARAVKRASNCIVAAHAAEKAWIEDVDLQARERPVPGFSSLVGGSVEVDRTLQDGDILDLGDLSLKVIHTPGHSKGSISLWQPEERALFSADAIPIKGDLPIYEDILSSVRSIQRLEALEGISFLLSAWDDPREGLEAYETMDQGLGYLQLIHQTVLDVAGDDPSIDPMKLCRRVLAKIGLPETTANPLIARSFQASLAVIDRRNLLEN
jgi:glyoxylase-like metal-dependent hydrolase (beta-lactamase superfamily II)